jgi:hypothetical protein
MVSAVTDQPPPGFRLPHFMERSIELPDNLTEAQLDGRACIRCGHEAQPGESIRPVEAWSELSSHLFEYADVEACTERVRSQRR